MYIDNGTRKMFIDVNSKTAFFECSNFDDFLTFIDFINMLNATFYHTRLR